LLNKNKGAGLPGERKEVINKGKRKKKGRCRASCVREQTTYKRVSKGKRNPEKTSIRRNYRKTRKAFLINTTELERSRQRKTLNRLQSGRKGQEGGIDVTETCGG